MSLERVKTGTFNVVCGKILASTSACMIDYAEGVCSGSRDLFNFVEITDSVSETVHD